MGQLLPGDWNDPPWNRPLDPRTALTSVPSEATISGLFISGVVEYARQNGVNLPIAREAYVAFRKYPLREHCELMIATARALWPQFPLREGMRRLGYGASMLLTQSMLGRVMLSSVEGPVEACRAMARSYEHHLSDCSMGVDHAQPGSVVVRLRNVPFFLDSHHVGVFEGALRYARVVEPRIRLHTYSRSDADFLCEWTP